RFAAAVPVFRSVAANAVHRLHQGAGSALRRRLGAIGGLSCNKVGAGLALAALGAALILVFASGRSDRVTTALDAGAQAQGPAVIQFAEERPLRESKLEFTRANLRYCTFQQIRLEAVGPITEGADLVVFNALVDDWNARCARYRHRAEDKEAVDA